MEDKKDVKKANNSKKKDNRSFCFCMHAQVDCLPGVVLDCNNHKREVCPLVEEVLAVNKEKEKQVKELKEKFKQKGSKGKTQTEAEPEVKSEEKPEAKAEEKPEAKKETVKKKDNRSFCFCMHAQVDCLPGVVLDCNNHKRKVCPLVEEVLSVNKEKEKQVEELKEKFKKKDSKAETKEEEKQKEEDKKEEKKKEAKDNRSFCFCMHAQVDCLPGVVLDCNNHKREVCPLVEEVLAVNKEKEKQVEELKEKFKKKGSKAKEQTEETQSEAQSDKVEKTEKDSESKKADKKEEKKKDNRAFCFCLGAQVNCSSGVVLDCNNHKRKICPVLLEALPVDEEQKAKVKDLRAMFDNSKG